MKTVGLHIDRGRVAATVIEKGFHQQEIKETFVRTFSTDIELVDLLKEKAGDWSGARIISSVPGRYFTQRIVELPFGDRKRVEKALPFEVEDTVPFALDEVEIDHLVLRGGARDGSRKPEFSVLAAMLPKTVLKKHLDQLRAGGIDPQSVVPSFLGLHQVATMLPGDGARILTDGSDLCLLTGDGAAVCRSLSGERPTTGLEHTLKALETGAGVHIEKAVLLPAGAPLTSRLAELGIAVETAAPEFEGRGVDDPASLGIALSGQMNFRRGEFAYGLGDLSHRRQRNALIAAGVFAVLLAAVNMGVKWYLVQSNFGKLDREIRDLYKQVVPDAKGIVDPVGQLRAKLSDSKRRYGVLGTGTSALDVMKTVTEGIPKEVRVSFQEFNLEGDRLKLQGDAASFESVDKMKAELLKAPMFSEVSVQDTRMGVDNKVKFRFEIKLKQVL